MAAKQQHYTCGQQEIGLWRTKLGRSCWALFENGTVVIPPVGTRGLDEVANRALAVLSGLEEVTLKVLDEVKSGELRGWIVGHTGGDVRIFVRRPEGATIDILRSALNRVSNDKMAMTIVEVSGAQ